MKINDILKNNLDENYSGDIPHNMIIRHETPPMWEIFTQLKTIPKKISYWFDKKYIVKVRKLGRTENYKVNYYILKLTDGTYLEIDY